MENKIIKEEGLLIRETETTNEKTRLKILIEGMYGKYNIESIEEVASILFAFKDDVMRLAEENYDDDVRKLIELSNHFEVSIDYLLNLTDYPKQYPRK